MNVNGRKRRIESSLDEEDEAVKKVERLTERVKELEESLADKLKESVEVGEDKKLLEEAVKEVKRLTDKVNKLEESLATKTKESVKVGEDKWLLEEDRRQLKEERKHLEGEKKTVEKLKTKVEEEKAKVQEEKALVVEAKFKVEEESFKLEEERVRAEKMLKEQQKLVECPVCLTLPREDKAVPCCPQGHFLCSPCMDQLTREGKLDCPTCRMPMGQCQSLLALTVVKNALHECSLQGCNMSVPFDKIKKHEEKCTWRLVICPGSGCGCTAMIPFCTVLAHVQECPDCVWPLIKNNLFGGSVIMDKAQAFDGKSVNWGTETLQLEQGYVFFVRFNREADIFMMDVVMKGSMEDCKEFMVEAAILDCVSGKSMFKATFQPRPMANQNEAVYCLSVPERGVSLVWKLDMLRKEYQIDFLVKVVKLE